MLVYIQSADISDDYAVITPLYIDVNYLSHYLTIPQAVAVYVCEGLLSGTDAPACLGRPEMAGEG